MPRSSKPKSPSQILQHEVFAKGLFLSSLGLPLVVWLTESRYQDAPFHEAYLPLSLFVALILWFSACYHVTGWLSLTPKHTLWGLAFIPGVLILLRKGDHASAEKAVHREYGPAKPIDGEQFKPLSSTLPEKKGFGRPTRRNLEVLKNSELSEEDEIFSEVLSENPAQGNKIVVQPRHKGASSPHRKVIHIAKNTQVREDAPSKVRSTIQRNAQDPGLAH